MDIEELTTWYGFYLLNKDDMEITDHLKMNGYTFYVSGENVILFILKKLFMLPLFLKIIGLSTKFCKQYQYS